MIFEQFEVPGLAHYSYAIGCRMVGEIAIVDPRRDVDLYLDFAKEKGVRIALVLETHIHADYASGARELVAATGAGLCLSAYDAGEKFEVATPHIELFDGDEIEIGGVRLQVLHTPGHTPEHISFLVFDQARSSDVPLMLLSGDFLFVGSLGRPDLLGEEAKVGLAERLFKSVHSTLNELPDGLEVYPAHGAGSMCGAGLGGLPLSTLGFERTANPYLDPSLSKEAFVEKILSEVPLFPDYYKRMKRINSEKRPALEALPGLKAIDADRFQERVDEGAVVIDLRSADEFGKGHIPHSFNIGSGSRLSVWASLVVPYDQPILLVGDGIEEAVRALVRVGLDDLVGYLKGGFSSWQGPIQTSQQLSIEEVGDALLLDVRTDREWEEGHLEGAVHIPAEVLVTRLDELGDKERSIAVLCRSGYRSSVAMSVLERAGFTLVSNVAGGMRRLMAQG